MDEDTALRDFILGYCQQVGGLVEPPAYGIYEVLLPDEVAARWGVDPYQRYSFSTNDVEKDLEAEVTHLQYGHPLVERVVEEVRSRPANAHLYINTVRIEKPGLASLVEKTFQFPNGRLHLAPNSVEKPRLYHYICFNFKANLISDEKRELILPVWMHLQGGYAVKGSEIERLAILETTNQFQNLEEALPAWQPANSQKSSLAPDVLNALLERARQSALDELAPNLESLQRRMNRYLELDRARLEQYYDDLRKGLERRLQKADLERRQVLEAKVEAVATERQAKLADAEQKYRIRVELELINLAVISQPKVDLEVEIKKRLASARRRVTWDPLLHRLEHLTCDVCGNAGDNLWLCESGHLAHAGCQAPQCVDCKRTYCLLCAEKIQRCVVCDRPVCEHSLIGCPDCGRGTCHEHLNLCHADDGQPQRLHPAARAVSQGTQPPAVTATPKQEQKLQAPAEARQAPPAPAPKARKEKTKSKSRTAKKTPSRVSGDKPKAITGQAIEVYAELAQPIVTAYVLYKDRSLATRTWELTPEGILVQCHCEKGWLCMADNYLYRPPEPEQIEALIMEQIHRLKSEYQVPERKISFYRAAQNKSFPERRLILRGMWKDAGVLAQARQGFDKSGSRSKSNA